MKAFTRQVFDLINNSINLPLVNKHIKIINFSVNPLNVYFGKTLLFTVPPSTEETFLDVKEYKYLEDNVNNLTFENTIGLDFIYYNYGSER